MSVTTGGEGNADRIRVAFVSWGVDNAPFLNLVADDVTWRIIGSTPVSGTHRSKQAFVEATSALADRLVKPTVVEVQAIHEAGDTVFLQWEGRSHSVTGRPYVQTYCWVIRMADGKAIEVVAYLDTALVDEMFSE